MTPQIKGCIENHPVTSDLFLGMWALEMYTASSFLAVGAVPRSALQSDGDSSPMPVMRLIDRVRNLSKCLLPEPSETVPRGTSRSAVRSRRLANAYL
jgi:hypothetical protein